MLHIQKTYTRSLADVEKNNLTSEQLLLKKNWSRRHFEASIRATSCKLEVTSMVEPACFKKYNHPKCFKIEKEFVFNSLGESHLNHFLNLFVPATSSQRTQKNPSPAISTVESLPTKNHPKHLTKFAIPRVTKALRGRTGRHMGWKVGKLPMRSSWGNLPRLRGLLEEFLKLKKIPLNAWKT